MKNLYYNLKNNIDKRHSLSTIRKMIKEPAAKHVAKDLFARDPELLGDLLRDEDAKTRKNCALLIGDLSMISFSKTLFNCYLHEKTRFVKSSYLEALSKLDFSSFLPEFHRIRTSLSKLELDDSNKKHVQQEIKLLTDMIILEEGIDTHLFDGFAKKNECILLTNKLHTDITIDQITDVEFLPMPSGIRFITRNLSKILPIRTYKELLFAIPDLRTCPLDPSLAAKSLANSSLITFLKKNHSGETPFYFRIELKSNMTMDKKTNYIKKLAAELEQTSKRQLINSVSNYEIELRLIESKSGHFNVLLKLFTIIDDRFMYRTETVAQSIKPYDAALLVELSKDYMKEDAQVLDPFCGVGTMLIERQMIVKANTSYGLDINDIAISRAKKNTDQAGQIIHYVNRDFFTFTHEYKFDEIFTQMPFDVGNSNFDTHSIYKRFFTYSRNVLADDGQIILYSHDPDYVKKYAKKSGFSIQKEIEILHKLGTYLYILT